ncbi:MAG: c-type cytochrome [Sulfuricaulis sp.]
MGAKKQELILSILMLLLTAPLVHAQGNPLHGEEIAHNGANKTPACASCHGLGGDGNAAQGYPRLVGLSAPYIMYQLDSFKDGTRRNAVMQPIAANLSRLDVTDVAAWYGEQKGHAPAVRQKASLVTIRHGERLAQIGDWSHNQPPCFSCHGPDAAGVPPNFPRLAGQYSNYLLTQLENFKNGTRHNDQEELMRSVAHNLSDQDMHAVATYLASLNPADGLRQVVTSVPTGEESLKIQGQGKESASDGKDHMTYDMPFTPLSDDAIPNDIFGQMVRLGENIFTNPQQYAKQYVGNVLKCSNCHLDRGRKPDSAPMWAAYVYYPAYRAKNHKVNTIQDRISGCFRFSENGHAPPMDGQEMNALVSYFAWLARGIPSNAQLEQHNFPKIAKAAREPDFSHGAIVFTQQCAYCHGQDGQGTVMKGGYIFPPLWGPRSYNWGAGMHKVETAAAFIKHNMPLGRGGSLSDQDAWDVAAFVNSHPRPPDPRKMKSKTVATQSNAGAE